MATQLKVAANSGMEFPHDYPRSLLSEVSVTVDIPDVSGHEKHSEATLLLEKHFLFP